MDDDPAFASLEWDSNWIALSLSTSPGGRCLNVRYNGPALTPAVSYYWRIKFKNENDQEGAFSDETAWFTKAQYTQVLDTKDYHLLNIPCYMAGKTFGEILSDDLPRIWVFKYDESTRSWILVTASDTFENNVGYFIWNDFPNTTIGFNGDNVSDEASFVIPVTFSNESNFANYGWNLVRNPYSLDISWLDNVVLQNCVTTLWRPWNGVEYLLWDSDTQLGCGSEIIPAGASFWVHANGSDAKITFYKPGGAPAPLPPPALNWTMRMNVQSGALIDTQTYFGAREGALTIHDQFDIMKIKSFAADYIRTSFDHPEWGKYAGEYALDIRPFPAEGGMLTWQMKVYATDADGTVNLTWQIPEELREGWEFFLRDENEGVVKNMIMNETYDYAAGGEDTRSFSISATRFKALILGDVDFDGEVTETDAALCARAEHGLETFSARQRYAADMNSDGKVDVIDALLILRRLRGHLPAKP